MGDHGLSSRGAFEHRANPDRPLGGDPVRKPMEEIRVAYCWADTQKVSRSGTVSLYSNTYEVDPPLAGTTVELV
ncbi:hypothetical protein JOF39_002865 [Glutamicibacter protophormiae]|uniref:Uncharacterized protein n=1 Tax=Glutamicibacter protophormiae TaxID=37930 RepID=A0ABS4XTE1_GLUPR|nr:hypothetical protein [Glutamicibacter protophormiae]GGL89136.1 hypothetical protein GCM10010038_18940 [Glutamicibacter protophormiae]